MFSLNRRNNTNNINCPTPLRISYPRNIIGLFAVLSECKELVNVNLSYNMLNGTIPDSIDNLVRLQNLNLRGNDITAVTPNISRCQMMTEFDISNN